MDRIATEPGPGLQAPRLDKTEHEWYCTCLLVVEHGVVRSDLWQAMVLAFSCSVRALFTPDRRHASMYSDPGP